MVKEVLLPGLVDDILFHCKSSKPMLQERALNALQSLVEIPSVCAELAQMRAIMPTLIGVLGTTAPLSRVRDGSLLAALETLKLVRGMSVPLLV